MTEREKYTGCAMAFFRARWQKVPRYKNSKRAEAMVGQFARCCKMTRLYIAKARAANT